jgi:signal transduction histidine kinase
MLEDMAANISAGLAIIGRDYRILWANKLLKQINGNNLVDKLCYSVFDRSNEVCIDCGVKKVFENGAPVDRHDYLHTGIDGRQEWIELIVTPIKDKDGNVVAALELAVNVSDRRQMQSKLAKYSEKLEELVEERTQQLAETQAKLVKSERLAAIGELAGMVGHDLRNPLTSIKGATYFLKTKYAQGMEPLGKEMLQTIEKSIEYSNKIINDLLDYSREIKLEFSQTTPSALLKTALTLIQVPQRIRLVDATAEAPPVNVDVAKISRVFTNLIRNACDAMPKGGTLNISSKEESENWVMVFEDTGTGMSPETLKSLWTPLFTTKAKGMGFGLSICKRIVEAHGGKIVVESTAQKGTVFTLTIPKSIKVPSHEEETWIFSKLDLEVAAGDETSIQPLT